MASVNFCIDRLTGFRKIIFKIFSFNTIWLLEHMTDDVFAITSISTRVVDDKVKVLHHLVQRFERRRFLTSAIEDGWRLLFSPLSVCLFVCLLTSAIEDGWRLLFSPLSVCCLRKIFFFASMLVCLFVQTFVCLWLG